MVALGFHNAVGASLAGSWISAVAFAANDVSDGVAKLPAFIADFRRDRYALTAIPAGAIAAAGPDSLTRPQSVSFAEMFVFSRASVGEYIDTAGTVQQAAVDMPRFDYRNGYRQLLLEGPATNLFLNAFAPSTQTVAVVSGTQYTVSCRGTGGLSVTGAATGSVTQASPLTFTASSTSLTITVSGSLSRVQIEAGSVPSSFVQTGGAPATRSADSCRLSAVGEALVQKVTATILVRGQGLSGSLGRLVGAGSGDEIIRLNTAQTNVLGGSAVVIAAISTPLPAFGLCMGWSASGRSGSYNGLAPVSDAAAPSINGQAFLGRNQAGAFAAGRYDSLTIWPFRASGSSIQARATAYA